MNIYKPPIVLDCGSETTKCGSALSEVPQITVRSVISDPVESEVRYPIERGTVKDWDGMEELWKRVFSEELKINLEEYPVLYTIPHLYSMEDINRIVQAMFETFHVPAIYMAKQTQLALYTSGRITGVVVDFGDGVTSCVPIDQGVILTDAAATLPLAGRDITDYMMALLQLPSYDRQIIKHFKEARCYISLDYDHEISTNKELKTYRLPDGRIINIGSELFQCPEILFRPELLNLPFEGIHKTIYSSILKCNSKLQREFFRNVLICGGSSMFCNTAERMYKELRALIPMASIVNVVAPWERKYLSWTGGSALASLPTFQNMWIAKKEYEEFGVENLRERFI